MKKLFIIFLFFFSFDSIGQENNRFYASYEDYLAGKYIQGWELTYNSWLQDFGGKESFKVIHNGSTDRKKLGDLPSELYTYDNILHRTFGGDCYTVLLVGPICLYTTIGTSVEYYSTGIAGQIKKITRKYFEQLLKEHDLLDQYKGENVKREFKDTPGSYETKLIEKDIKYLKIINQNLSN
jgi:hypothetical protein